MKITIDRERWLRGDEKSFLLRTGDEKMCCLGFLALECGYTEAQIRDRGTPMGLIEAISVDKWPAGTITTYDDYDSDDSERISELMSVNDNSEFSDPLRETRITQLMAELGIEVEFK